MEKEINLKRKKENKRKEKRNKKGKKKQDKGKKKKRKVKRKKYENRFRDLLEGFQNRKKPAGNLWKVPKTGT